MPFTQITTSNLDNTINTKLAAAEAANAAVANIVSLAISSVQIANSTYDVLDDTAANTGGGYLVINGTGFTNQCVVIVGTTNATSTTFANTKQLRAQVPALSAATYPVYVVDSVTGATAIKVNGLTYSSFPAWSTGSSLSNQVANTAFGVNLSATSDSSVTYANTTALPAGTTLASNGYFSGTVSIGAQTTYSFDVKATDVENQDATRTFSLTVTVTPATRLWLWGGLTNYSGETGQNDRASRSSPTQVGSGTDWAQTSGSRFWATDRTSIYAVKTNGTLWAWGRNTNGQLGTDDRIDRSSPTQIGTNTNWSKVHAGGLHAFAIKTDGTLWAWGVPNDGRLGLNSTGVYRSSPTQVGTDTNWKKVAASEKVNIATKTDGTLWTWGYGDYGSLGRNNRTFVSSPTQVGSATNWDEGYAGARWNIAVKTDGSLWSIGGFDYLGVFGLNLPDGVYRSSPVQIGTSTTWTNKIATNFYGVAAIKSDGALWTWGDNGSGQLGQNVGTSTHRSSPVQVGVSTNWSQIAGMHYAFAATKTDGTLWLWGQNSYGQLGLNNRVDKSSPTQVGTNTNWSTTANTLSGSQTTFMAITTN